jgi:CRISPR-associated protein Cmr1
MEKLAVTLKTVTPLFLGGAEPNESAELRAPSIKGAMRFWYRAIDPDYRENEPKIFGSTDEGEGSFLLKVTSQNLLHGNYGDSRWDRTKTSYLGFGPINRGRTTRPYIKSGSEFSIEIIFKPKIQKDVLLKVEKSLWALFMFGGLGARSRKGFGSLMVIEINPTSLNLPWKFNDFQSLKETIKQFWGSIPKTSGLQEHTCWSLDARCVVVDKETNGESALEWLGDELHKYRSYHGDNLPNFKKLDHDAMLYYLKNGTIPNALPLRTAFGLPHNYFFTRSLDRVGGEINLMDGKQKGRRASPLLLHIQELTNGKACVVATFLPARLIPIGKKVTISGNRQTPTDLELPDNFTAIEGFMDRLVKNGMEVKP